jgi:DGQHR domain-containing protein
MEIKWGWKYKPRITELHKQYWKSLKKANEKLGRPVSKKEWLEQAEADGVKSHRGTPPKAISSHMIGVLFKKGNLKIREDKFLAISEVQVEKKEFKLEKYFKKFHDKIKKLFEDAGFIIVKSEYYEKGPDIIAKAEGNKIIIQCKCAEKEGKGFSQLDHLIDEYSTKVKKYRAKVAILALGKYKIPKYYERNKDKILEKDKVIIWNDKEIDYYTKIIKAIGEWAKYPLLGDFGIKKEFDKPSFVHAMKVRQSGIEYIVFSVPVEILLKIADVYRREHNVKAYQRIVSEKRVKGEIKDFLETPNAIFPTNLVCAFRYGAEYNEKTSMLKIPMMYSSVWIVDGQHRLYGFCHVNEMKRKDFNLICSGFNIKGLEKCLLDESQQADIFRTINLKAKKVSKELLIALAIQLGLADRKIRIVEKLRRQKIFKNKVKTIDTKGEIHVTTLVETHPMERLVKDKGIISRWYGKRREPKDVPENFCFNIINKYFILISETFKEEWYKPKKYILATDRGVRGLLRLLEDILEYSNGLKDIDKVKKCLEALRGFEFENEQLKRKYAGEGGADQLTSEWRAHIRNTISDFAPEKRLILKEEVIEPGQLGKAEKFLQYWFSQIKGFDGKIVKGELAYIDPTTFDYLNWLPKECTSIKILVSSIDEFEKCKKLMEEMKKNGRDLEIYSIKLIQEEAEHEYEHMRWLAGKNFEIDIGYDLKKKSLGNKKDSMKIIADVNVSKNLMRFDEFWEGIVSGVSGKEVKIKKIFPV